MAKIFNVTANCKPDKHYMVKLDTRLAAIKKTIDNGSYFTINRARQYGKTTTLRALNQYLQGSYYVVLMDFQTFGTGEFKYENTFAQTFSRIFLRILKRNILTNSNALDKVIAEFEEKVKCADGNLRLQLLFEYLSDICDTSVVI